MCGKASLGIAPRVEKQQEVLHAMAGYSFLFVVPLYPCESCLLGSFFVGPRFQAVNVVGGSFLVSKSCIHVVGPVLYSYSVDGVMIVDASEPNFAARLFAPSSPECSGRTVET